MGLLREDKIFAAKDCTKFALNRGESSDMVSYSENAKARFHGNCTFAENGTLINTVLDTVEYHDLVKNLMGPVTGEPPSVPTFLTKTGSDDHKVMYTSYSRSGNTFLRRYLEQITGINTGSDGDLDYSLHH